MSISKNRIPYKSSGGRIDLQRKIEKAKGNYINCRLGALKKNHRRFKVEKVINQTALAYQLQINGKLYWLPIKKVTVGIHPSKYYYAVDVPDWLAIEKNLRNLSTKKSHVGL
jgi:hypothetical protein